MCLFKASDPTQPWWPPLKVLNYRNEIIKKKKVRKRVPTNTSFTKKDNEGNDENEE